MHTYALDSPLLPEQPMSTPLNISLAQQGFATDATLHCNLGTAPLVEAALANNEGILAKDGPLVVKTCAHTGRSAKDKFIVRDFFARFSSDDAVRHVSHLRHLSTKGYVPLTCEETSLIMRPLWPSNISTRRYSFPGRPHYTANAVLCSSYVHYVRDFMAPIEKT